jgi:hypothetical protein
MIADEIRSLSFNTRRSRAGGNPALQQGAESIAPARRSYNNRKHL